MANERPDYPHRDRDDSSNEGISDATGHVRSSSTTAAILPNVKALGKFGNDRSRDLAPLLAFESRQDDEASMSPRASRAHRIFKVRGRK